MSSLEPATPSEAPVAEKLPRAHLIGVGLALGWAGVIAGLVLVPIGWRNAVIDDAFITFRYAHNLANGLGLVFNPGERVEGFTSLLWTLIMAGGLKLGMDAPHLSQMLGVLCNLGLAALLYLYARRRLGHGPIVALLAPMLLVANLNVGAWAAHGLETPLFSFLLLAGLLLSVPDEQDQPQPLRRPLTAALLLVLATWTRPEGMLYFALVAASRAGVALRRRRWPGGELAFYAVYLIPVIILFLWRHAYFGQWLPNTFYAKASGGAGQLEEGRHYLLTFFDHSLLQGAVLLPLAGMLPRVTKGFRPTALAWVAATAAYAVWVGGDTFAGARFFVPILAPLYLLVQDGLNTLLNSVRVVRPVIALFVLAIGMGTVLESGPEVARQADIATAMTRNRAYLGRLLRAIVPPDTTIALNTVGALPYYAERPIIDLYGLTDAHIAHQAVRPVAGGGTGHEKGDGAYVLARKPDIILLRNVWLADVPIEAYRSLQGVSEREIAASPVFDAEYVPMNLRLRPDLQFGFYIRRSSPGPAIEERFKKVDLEALGPLKELTAERGTEQLYYEEGNRLAAAGKLEAAIKAYQKALDLYPDGGEVHLAMGQILEQLTRLDEARVHYKRATTLLTESAQAWFGLGNVEARLGQSTASVTAYHKALFVDPTLVDAYANLASQLLKDNRFDEAVPALRGGLARAPNDIEMWIRLGMATGTLQRWNDAIEARNRLTQLAPKDPRVQAYEKWLAGRLPATK